MNKNILLGVTGGIAAYKSANIISMLKKKGYNVRVIMTKSATEIITPLTLETLARDRVITDMWEKKSNYDVEHISLAEWADICLIAPATYNIVGKVANGIADDMLSTVISATKAPVYFALAMNNNMYDNPILKKNINFLKELNYNFIEAEEGFLACNDYAKGRLAKEENIISIIDKHFEKKDGKLQGKKVLITAGPTKEKIDPIRYLSNNSSGQMGYSLAKECLELGAEVILISGPTNLSDPVGVNTIRVETALEMNKEVFNHYDDTDIVIACAAVSDYRAKKLSLNKIKKSDDDLKIELIRNPDILYNMGQNKKHQILIGFCAESENLIDNAIKKLKKKNLDFIVANDVKNFASSTNKAYFLDSQCNITEFKLMDKAILAKNILEKIEI